MPARFQVGYAVMDVLEKAFEITQQISALRPLLGQTIRFAWLQHGKQRSWSSIKSQFNNASQRS